MFLSSFFIFFWLCENSKHWSGYDFSKKNIYLFVYFIPLGDSQLILIKSELIIHLGSQVGITNSKTVF